MPYDFKYIPAKILFHCLLLKLKYEIAHLVCKSQKKFANNKATLYLSVRRL